VALGIVAMKTWMGFDSLFNILDSPRTHQPEGCFDQCLSKKSSSFFSFLVSAQNLA
jgi:hypothetical protein